MNAATKIVRIHSGSAHVRGRARRYRYVIASLFVQRTTRDGRTIWVNSGIHAGPYRGYGIATRAAHALASEHGAEFRDQYGSLHNSQVAP